MEWYSWAVIMLECRVNDILQDQSIFHEPIKRKGRQHGQDD